MRSSGEISCPTVKVSSFLSRISRAGAKACQEVRERRTGFPGEREMRLMVEMRSASRSGSTNSSSTITVGSARLRTGDFQKANSSASWSRRRACGQKTQTRPWCSLERRAAMRNPCAAWLQVPSGSGFEPGDLGMRSHVDRADPRHSSRGEPAFIGLGYSMGAAGRKCG